MCDYDEAIAWFTRVLHFELREDTPRGAGKRWVRVEPPGGGPGLLLARWWPPSGIVFTGAIPLMATGKIYKTKFRQTYAGFFTKNPEA